MCRVAKFRTPAAGFWTVALLATSFYLWLCSADTPPDEPWRCFSLQQPAPEVPHGMVIAPPA